MLMIFDALNFKKKINKTLINIGSTTEMTIKEYADLIKKHPEVLIKFNNEKLDGVMRKKLNLSLASQHGWKTKMNFQMQIKQLRNLKILKDNQLCFS